MQDRHTTFSGFGKKAADFLIRGFVPHKRVPVSETILSIPVLGQGMQPRVSVTKSDMLNKPDLVEISLNMDSLTFADSLTLALGLDAAYDLTYHRWRKFSIGFDVEKANFCASMILADHPNIIKASYIHFLTKSKSIIVADFKRNAYTKKNVLTIGGLYPIGGSGFVKVKVNNYGLIGVALRCDVLGVVSVNLGLDFDTKAPRKGPMWCGSISLK